MCAPQRQRPPPFAIARDDRLFAPLLLAVACVIAPLVLTVRSYEPSVHETVALSRADEEILQSLEVDCGGGEGLECTPEQTARWLAAKKARELQRALDRSDGRSLAGTYERPCGTRGEVTIVAHVAPSGRVTGVRVKRATTDAATVACVERRVRRTVFAQTTEAHDVERTFRFGTPS